MVRFTLFRVPVVIHPGFWIFVAIFGGALNLGDATDGDSSAEVLSIALFVVIATISILVHEFGHALVGRRLAGGYPVIQLVALRGVAMNHGGKFTRWTRCAMLAAGPGAGFALGLIAVFALALTLGVHDAVGLLKWNVVPGELYPDISPSTFTALFEDRPLLGDLIRDVLWINFWWGILNLIPVMPLDGGRIMELFVRPQPRAHLVATVVGGIACIGSLYTGYWYWALLMAYYTSQNFRAIKDRRLV